MAPKLDPTTQPENTADTGTGGSGTQGGGSGGGTTQQTSTGSGSGTGRDTNQGRRNNNDWLSDEFLNGECFVAGEIGEIEEVRNYREVIFADDTPAARAPGDRVEFNSDQAERFIKINYARITSIKTTLPPADAAKICFLRFLAVRVGLISPEFATDAFHVKYNEAVRLNAANTVAAVTAATTNVRELLSEDTRRSLQKNFSNIVCCIAYMFRVRGHHYIPDMKTKYQDLWTRCQKSGDNPGIDWELVAHDSLHAIMPIVLDNYWVNCSESGKIAGALVKRIDSAPAGVAAIRAVYAGAEDLRMAIPGIYNKFKAHFDELDGLVKDLRSNRWSGSINRRYYGPSAVAVNFNEQRFGAIASVIVHCLQAFAPGSPLLQSKALQRISNNAPITGGFVSTGIATLSRDPTITRAMLEMPAESV